MAEHSWWCSGNHMQCRWEQNWGWLTLLSLRPHPKMFPQVKLLAFKIRLSFYSFMKHFDLGNDRTFFSVRPTPLPTKKETNKNPYHFFQIRMFHKFICFTIILFILERVKGLGHTWGSQGLLLDLCLGMTFGGTWGTICVAAENSNQIWP